MNEGYEGFVGKVTHACGGILLGAMALYGAVAILEAIWLPLCLLAFVTAASIGLWVGFRRWRGW